MNTAKELANQIVGINDTNKLTALLKQELSAAWTAGFQAAVSRQNPYTRPIEVMFVFCCDGTFAVQVDNQIQRSYGLNDIADAAYFVGLAISSDDLNHCDAEKGGGWLKPTAKQQKDGTYFVCSLEQLKWLIPMWANIKELKNALALQGVFS